MDWEYLKENSNWRWLFAAGAGLCLLTLFGFLARFHTFFEIINTFRVQYFILLIILSIPFFIKKRFKSGAFLAGFCLINFLCFFGFLFNSSGASLASFKEKLLVFNVFSPNRNYQETVDYILKENPKHIALLEITPKWEAEILKRLKKDYPNYVSVPRTDNFGIMFLSKKPFKDKIIHLDGIPLIKVEMDGVKAGNKLTVFAVHPLPPINQALFHKRNKFIHDLKDFVNEAEGNKIVCGDFNMVPWSPFLRDFTKATGTFTGGGICPSWPAGLWPMQVPIDNALLSSKMVLINKKIGPNLGSDHLPVSVSYYYQ
jgi:endonuclease/exonuclease/phosphatase (EEP) superfamily protein YafD